MNDDILLEDLFEPLQIGEKVPNIPFKVFKDGDAEEVSINKYIGKWLIMFFYPADFTFVCPTELQELSGLYPSFQQENAEVISVSTDTVFTHKAWKDTSEAIGEIKYPMAEDPSHALSTLFGVLIEDEGVALRGSFIIDPEGVLRCIEINDNSIGRSAKELLRKLKAAKFVNENKGKVCPASWEEGKDTLEPGMDLVGKI